MILFLYSDQKYEYQAKACITSLTNKISDNDKIVYYTIGFESDFEFKNLHKIKIDLNPQWPSFLFYKSQLSLLTMRLFPNEFYCFTDTDVLFSRRFEFDKVKSNLSYPLASFGPFECPFSWTIDSLGNKTVYNELPLMKYFNVDKRSQRYVWSCFYSFGQDSKDFFEEYTSMCKNQYLIDQREIFLPFRDETAFNICLWKRNAAQNLGFAFVNTNTLKTLKHVEESNIVEQHMGSNIDAWGGDWEYINDSSKVLMYHGFKNQEEIDASLRFLLQK